MEPEITSVGTFVDVGSVPGVFAAADPTGRYLTAISGGVLAGYDLAAGLTAVASYRMEQPHLLAVHPGGEAVAILTQDWSLQLWRSGERVLAVPTEVGGSQAVTG